MSIQTVSCTNFRRYVLLHTIDVQMAAQFLVFLEQWIETFPEYRDDDVGMHQIC
jgi:hypothetical protein